MTFSYGPHSSVLYNECLEGMNQSFDPDKSFVFADLTFGAGGHTLGLLKKYPHAKVFAVDQDPEAIANGKKLIQENDLKDRLILNYQNYVEFIQIMSNQQQKFDGILLDLGVSSHQFDMGHRGFSYRKEGPLDMRMNIGDDSRETAADIVNYWQESELADLFFQYGEEHFSRKIAKAIVEKRQERPFKTTKDLEEIIFLCYPKKFRHGRTHPATKCFQALRIAVNAELEVLKNSLPMLLNCLNPGAVCLIITFHSLEDRIVKHFFKDQAKEKKDMFKLLWKKPCLPSQLELSQNKRSRSAKLRGILKLIP